MRISEQHDLILKAFGDYNVKGHNGGFMIWVMYEGQMYTGAGPKGGHEKPLRHAIEAFYNKNKDVIHQIINEQENEEK